MIRNIGTFAAAALAIVAFALAPSTAMAQSYSGNWPMKWNVTYPGPPFDGHFKYCLTLTDDGSAGFRHSGGAVLNGSGQINVPGVFQVINNELVATFEVVGSGEELSGWVFVGPARNGNIGKGFSNLTWDTITGKLVFGKKDTCGNSE